MVAVTRGLISSIAACAGFGFKSGHPSGPHPGRSPHSSGCSLANFVPDFPSTQTALVTPSEAPKFLGLAYGVQNYTCSSSNTYTSIGALAEVLDASCLATQQNFATSQTALFDLWSADPASIQESIAALAREHLPGVLGQHYFVPNPKTGVGLSPKWDFTSAKLAGDADAFMIGAVNSSIPSPDVPASDVTWLHVVNVEGGLADTIFRFDTVGGQPPSSCISGQDPDISVKYTAKYAFYGGSVA